VISTCNAHINNKSFGTALAKKESLDFWGDKTKYINSLHYWSTDGDTFVCYLITIH
jgi:hypothetical protein